MSYQNSIMKASGCTQEEVNEVEDYMRNSIVHSTLDWLSASQFNRAAKEAYELYQLIEVLKPYAEMVNKEWFNLTDAEMDKAVAMSNIK